MKSLRQRIRDVTDKLGPGESIIFAELWAQLAGPKPKRSNLGTTITQMVNMKYLKRCEAPKGNGKGVRFSYCSGPKSLIDGRTKNGSKARPGTSLGFMALAALERNDPPAYRRAMREIKTAERGRRVR